MRQALIDYNADMAESDYQAFGDGDEAEFAKDYRHKLFQSKLKLQSLEKTQNIEYLPVNRAIIAQNDSIFTMHKMA